MAILQIHAQGPWQCSFVTRYHLKIITICSGFCSGAFRQSEISFTAPERDLIFVCERRWRYISRRLQSAPKSSGLWRVTARPSDLLHLPECQIVPSRWRLGTRKKGRTTGRPAARCATSPSAWRTSVVESLMGEEGRLYHHSFLIVMNY